jgi:hypothetical protein
MRHPKQPTPEISGCHRCHTELTPWNVAINGVGREMLICKTCLNLLFELGPRQQRSPEMDRRLPIIQAQAREGLRRLKRSKIASVGKVRYGTYTGRHR